jgi:hypothetical protein
MSEEFLEDNGSQAPVKKKRVLTEKQREAGRANLAKGRQTRLDNKNKGIKAPKKAKAEPLYDDSTESESSSDDEDFVLKKKKKSKPTTAVEKPNPLAAEMAQMKETMALMIEHQKKQKRKEKERSKPAPSSQPLPPINIVMPPPPVHSSVPQVSALEALRARMMR